MTLEYYREYRSLRALDASCGLSSVSNVNDTIKWVENALITSGLFGLPSKRELVNLESGIEVIVVDTTEIPIQKPKNPKKQKSHYSGKKAAYSKSSAYNRQKSRNYYFYRAA